MQFSRLILFGILMVLFTSFFSVSWSLSVAYANMFLSCLSELKFFFGLNLISSSFIIMVSLVSSLVFCYGQYYLDHYNNIKFITLTFSFMFSMMFLCLSFNVMNMMIGWDLLGISSLCLIMFYPNKRSMYNSFLTLFYNRLGDILMVYFFCICILLDNSFLHFFSENFYSFLFCLFLCTFTKSAQFPLSSWLPAAMSAPTPISAMVHSSTLVTAGIFVIFTFFSSFEACSLFYILSFVSSLTFMLGGLISNFQKDFKKIIAFSTLSQISLIIFFLSLGLIFISMGHMIIHAFFKTLLFCVAGSLFISSFFKQFSFKVSSREKFSSVMSFLLVSGFSMSGFYFSSSFYSKDLAIENLMEMCYFSLFLFSLLGSLFTLSYTSKIFSSMFLTQGTRKFNSKNYNDLFISFSILSLLTGFFFSMPTSLYDSCFLSGPEAALITLLIFSPLLLKKITSFLLVSKVIKDFFFMKKLAFSRLTGLSWCQNLYFSDSLFFSPANFTVLFAFNNFSTMKDCFLILFLGSLMWVLCN